MHLIGLTGGIASGKSTVARRLREKGALLVDADEVAREIVEPGQPALEEIARRFPGVVGPDGRLDRARLGARVFGDDAERAALNAITHPRVRARMLELAAAAAGRGEARVVFDVPLLIENGLQQGMHAVILVWAPREVQKARLMARDGLGAVEAEARLAAQLPLDEKRRHATWIIDNSGALEDTLRQVDDVWQKVLAL